MQLSWPVKRAKPIIDSYQNLNHESWWELAVKRERELRLSSFDQALRYIRHFEVALEAWE